MLYENTYFILFWISLFHWNIKKKQFMQCKYSTCNVVHNNPTFSSQMWIFKVWSSQLWPCIVWETLPNFWRILHPLQGSGMSCQMSHNKAAKVTCSNDINYFVIIFEIPQKQMRYTLHMHVCLLIKSFYLTAWWWVCGEIKHTAVWQGKWTVVIWKFCILTYSDILWLFSQARI